jgi:hypothetical protein
MSATEAGAITAVAFHLLHALDAYGQETAQLARERVDPEAYHRMRLHLDAMRPCVQDVPGLSASWVEVLIRHFELAHVHWRIEQGQAEAASVERIATGHAAAVRGLRTLCTVAIQRDACLKG